MGFSGLLGLTRVSGLLTGWNQRSYGLRVGLLWASEVGHGQVGPVWMDRGALPPSLGPSDRFAACHICHQLACLAPDSASRVGAWPVSGFVGM